jgi:hypothetical protein
VAAGHFYPLKWVSWIKSNLDLFVHFKFFVQHAPTQCHLDWHPWFPHLYGITVGMCEDIWQSCLAHLNCRSPGPGWVTVACTGLSAGISCWTRSTDQTPTMKLDMPRCNVLAETFPQSIHENFICPMWAISLVFWDYLIHVTPRCLDILSAWCLGIISPAD